MPTSLLIAALTPLFAIQTTPALHSWYGGAVNESFGVSFAELGDINGDSISDVVVGATGTEINGSSYIGSVFVYSGSDGSELFRFDGDQRFASFGGVVSNAGDMNSDGVNDIIITANAYEVGSLSTCGTVYVYSGADGSLIHQWFGFSAYGRFGSKARGGSDLDQDGVSDIIIAARLANPNGMSRAGSVYCYSGATGLLIMQFNGLAADDYFGSALSFLKDITADGVDEILVGSPFADPNGMSRAGSVYCYSGSTGNLLYHWNGADNRNYFGDSLADAGDVNNDGVNDIVVGAPDASPNGIHEAGAVYILSGADGSLITRLNGLAGFDDFGQEVAGAGDLDGDGFDDVLVSNPVADFNGFTYSGVVYAYSGSDYSTLFRWIGSHDSAFLGSSIGSIADIDGDGQTDILISGRDENSPTINDSGGAHIYSGTAPPPNFSVANFVAGQYSLFSITGISPNSQVTIGYSLVGPGPINTSYGIVDMTPPIAALAVISANSIGEAWHAQLIPLGAAGRSFYTQALCGSELSNSLSLVVQ
jgi:hypothetical protein